MSFSIMKKLNTQTIKTNKTLSATKFDLALEMLNFEKVKRNIPILTLLKSIVIILKLRIFKKIRNSKLMKNCVVIIRS